MYRFAFIAISSVVFVGLVFAQGTIPPLLPGEIAVVGKLQPQYVLSDGTLGKIVNWQDVDEVPTGRIELEQVKKTLTEAQVNALTTTAVELIAAPGEDKIIIVQRAFFRFNTSDTGADAGTANVTLRWRTADGTTTFLSSTRMADLWSAITASPSRRVLIYPNPGSPKDNVVNSAIVIWSNKALPTAVTTGEIIVFYRVLDLSFE